MVDLRENAHAADTDARRGGWALGSRIAAAVGALAVSSLSGRLLGAAAFGAVAVVASLATAGSIAGTLGLNRLLLRALARRVGDERPPEAHAVTAGRLLAAGLLGAGVAVAGATATLVDGSAALVVGAACLTVAGGVLLVLSDVLRGVGDVVLANLTAGRSGGALVTCSLAVALVGLRPGGAASVVGLQVGATVASACIAGLGVRRLVPRVLSVVGLPRPSRLATRALVAGAAPFAVTQLLLFAGTQVDLWIAGGTLGAEDAGAYAAAVRLVALVTMPLTAAQLALVAPVAVLGARDDRAGLEWRVRRAARAAAMPASVGLAACVLVPGTVVGVVVGPGFGAAAVPLAVLALGQSVNVATGLCGTVLAMCGQERPMVKVLVVGAATSLAADLVGARAGGLTGLAVASALTTAATFVALWYLARRLVGVRTEPVLTTRIRPGCGDA